MCPILHSNVHLYSNIFSFYLFPGYGDPPPMTPREFDMGLPCLNVEENQFLQLTAVDRCNSRLSAVYAEGST